jgi:hypothetical protein
MSAEYNRLWRQRNPEKWRESKQRNYSQTVVGNFNEGRGYDQHDDLLILNSSYSDRELHSIIGRSVQGIQVRRSRLKKD